MKAQDTLIVSSLKSSLEDDPSSSEAFAVRRALRSFEGRRFPLPLDRLLRLDER